MSVNVLPAFMLVYIRNDAVQIETFMNPPHFQIFIIASHKFHVDGV